jgi:hypothetical protein
MALLLERVNSFPLLLLRFDIHIFTLRGATVFPYSWELSVVRVRRFEAPRDDRVL